MSDGQTIDFNDLPSLTSRKTDLELDWAPTVQAAGHHSATPWIVLAASLCVLALATHAYLKLRRSRPELIAGWAARLAGADDVRRDEWLSMLDGAVDLPPGQQRRLAIGLFWAALRTRIRALTRHAWRPVDWLLSREERSNTFIASAVGTATVYFAVADGVHALITAEWQSCAGLGGGLFVLARWLRKVRGIELAERERRSDRAS